MLGPPRNQVRKLAMLDYFEEEEEEQQQETSAQMAIKKMASEITLLLCRLVFFSRPKKGYRVQDVT